MGSRSRGFGVLCNYCVMFLARTEDAAGGNRRIGSQTTSSASVVMTRCGLLAAIVFLAARVSSQRGGTGLTCPEKNGRFPSPTRCDTYVQCEDGVPEEIVCPDGLLFNAKARYFTYPCQYPVGVDCEGRVGLQIRQSTGDCPHQYGYFRLGDNRNCGQFMNCVDGRGYVFDCPEGLAFNQESYRCDWPDEVESCDAEAFLGFRCPEDSGLFGDEYRFYRNPADCQKYFICVNGRPRLYSCGNGYAFNDDIGGCDGIENVTSCALPVGGSPAPSPIRRG